MGPPNYCTLLTPHPGLYILIYPDTLLFRLSVTSAVATKLFPLCPGRACRAMQQAGIKIEFDAIGSF